MFLDDKTGRLVGTSKINKFLSNENLTVAEFDEVDIIVSHMTDIGVNVIINQMHKGLVYDNQVFKDIRVGDYVIIERAGDVIPHILEVIKEKRNDSSQKYIFPKECPSCKEPLIKPEKDAVIRCVNENNCESQLIEKIKHFISRDAMNIEGLGEKQIESFFKKGILNSISDIYNLSKFRNNLIKEKGYGEKSIGNLLESIENSKNKDRKTKNKTKEKKRKNVKIKK